ncbi:complement factor D-like [Mytilus galloprovincialis]|uniref:complement factor D-like n=1 Tax=Mytilus galloprovincialis TaxID=29158 RepID=UPI003F7CCB15
MIAPNESYSKLRFNPLLVTKIVVGIAGGEDADIEDFPYVARIEARDRKGEPWEDWCTAVILSETWLLTIARCLEDPLINRRVLAGFSDISDPNIQIRTIKHQKKHPHFDRKFKEKNDDALWENDIAVIELHTPLTFGPTVTSIPYSTSSDSVDLDNCQIAGWGEIDSNGTEPENLQFAEDITVLTTEECRQLNTDTPFVETQICVIDENRKIQPCFGDNGGPLACKTTDGTSTTVLSGIFAWQYTTCNANRSTVYTNIPLYADWIERQTGIEGYTLN